MITQRRVVLVAMAVGAYVLSTVALVRAPFAWFAVYFHEMAHGLAALVTGGSIVALELNFDGSGSLTHSGSAVRALVAFAGYPGSVLCGAALFLAAVGNRRRSGIIALVGTLGVLATALLWARDLETWIVCGGIAAVLALTAWSGRLGVARWALAFIGVYAIVAGTLAPLALVGSGVGHNDANTLAQELLLPSALWVAAWVAIGVLVFWGLLRRPR